MHTLSQFLLIPICITADLSNKSQCSDANSSILNHLPVKPSFGIFGAPNHHPSRHRLSSIVRVSVSSLTGF
ncbi:hypothetical protein F5Y11DRAFT_337022 [Daldinia sp. FL1419]|nr:hypothetical protein F5Y11DRAFT_337022 [Daldinia sp. FL1419]